MTRQYIVNMSLSVYFDSELTSGDYDTVGDTDSLDISLLSCYSQLSAGQSGSLQQDSNMGSGFRHRLGGGGSQNLLKPRRRRNRHRAQEQTVSHQIVLNGEDDEDDEDDDTDEIIGIAANLQREIKQLIESRKAHIEDEDL